MNIFKKNIITLGIIISFLSSSYNHKETYNSYQINENNSSPFYATYSDGLIYIGNEEFILGLSSNEKDILVIDKRNSKNPNMRIISSYKINNPHTRRIIIEVLQNYEKENPSSWNRSTESMEIEWFIHNIFYNFSYTKERSCDVDFDNEDERIYSNKVLKKIFNSNRK